MYMNSREGKGTTRSSYIIIMNWLICVKSISQSLEFVKGEHSRRERNSCRVTYQAGQLARKQSPSKFVCTGYYTGGGLWELNCCYTHTGVQRAKVKGYKNRKSSIFFASWKLTHCFRACCSLSRPILVGHAAVVGDGNGGLFQRERE